MNKKFELLREAVGCYKANHFSGYTNEKELLEFIDKLEELTLTSNDAEVFFNEIMNPKEANEALKEAMKKFVYFANIK